MRDVDTRFGDVIGLRPNWNQAITQEVEFDTEIRVTRSQVEQREANRQTPRFTLVYPVAVTQRAAARLFADVRRDPNKVWSVPVPWRRTRMVSPATTGSASIAVEDVPFWLVPGTRLVLRGMAPDGPVEAVEVASVAGDVVTLVETLLTDHDSGTRVHWAVPCRYPDEVRLATLAPDVFSGVLGLELDPGRVPQPSATSTMPLYEGNDLFLWKPNWLDTINVSLSREADRIDFGRGRIEVPSVINFTSERRQPHFYQFDYPGAEQLLAFFMRKKGRRGSFWAPSWTKDFRLAFPASAGALFLHMEGRDFFDAYNGNRVYNRVVHTRPDGSYQINAVASMSVVDGNTRVVFTNNWVQDLTADSKLHWLFRSRFSSDTLSLTWETTQVAHAQFSLTTIPTDEVPL